MAAPMYNPGMGMAPGMEPPEVSSIKSLLGVSRILTLIIAILELIGGIVSVIALIVVFGGLGAFGFFGLISFVVNIISYIQQGQIRDMVNAGQLAAAKEKTLVWMILGFIFGYVIIGIILLIAWLKFDPAINAMQRQQMPGWGQPPMAQAPVWQAPAAAPAPTAPAAPPAAQPAPAPQPAPAAAAPQLTTCPRCGRPATWIPQYSRWYCYNDQQYL